MKNRDEDRLLAERLKSGDRLAYDMLMDRYYVLLCNYAYTFTKNHDNAEDIVQNVMVDIWSKRKKIKPELSLKNYLYKAVYNSFISHYRKQKPVIYLEKKHIDAVESIVESNHEEMQRLIELVHREIDKLPKKCREIFLLNKRDGLTHTEISEHLDISLKTVEGHITRAFKILRDRLEERVGPVLFLVAGNLFDIRESH
ncbi:RNA polymerase sigma-70 factor, ECF subfamily [Pseudozobellia thermophila]|uniref:RNA polymerase sigma-70 factor, ECF subfamily n=2 Tax=Pseudozobellia thermophila TaxID=192903 RepID=A0A1M6BC21_9FLAO|nr:RNA polymerase sigma-70 factor, ECF subfamily [Pseudozobellia thermophila]